MTTTTTASLTYLVPNDMRRELERPIAIRPVVNVESASFGVATIGVPALDGVPVDVVRSDMTAETMRAAAQAAERAAFPLRMIQIEPLKPTPEVARLYRELTDRAADEFLRLLCGSLIGSAIALPPGCEVEYLEADAGELPGTWALGPCHDGAKPTG